MATRLLRGGRYDRHSRPAPLPGSDSQDEAGRKAYPLVVVSPGHGMQLGPLPDIAKMGAGDFWAMLIWYPVSLEFNRACAVELSILAVVAAGSCS